MKAIKPIKTVKRLIPYGHHSILQEDIDAVCEALRSDFLTQGPGVGRFEGAFKKETGAPHAVACSSGTAALHLAALASGLGPGDRVLVPAVSFVASANLARFVGSEVVFADINPDDLTMSSRVAEDALTKARSEGRPFRAMVSVDLAGHPCDMAAFGRLKKIFGLTWIQDACHALGATWTDGSGTTWKMGGWPVPDLTIFSFHPVKHITTGEGGMVTTHQARLAERLCRLRTHGITRDPEEFVFRDEAFDRDGKPNPWYYEVQGLGFNYRLTDLQSALGISQLKRLPGFLERRRKIMEIYHRELLNVGGLRFPVVREGIRHAWHLAVVRIDFTGRGLTRGQVMRRLHELGVDTQVHYIPIPMMPFYAGSESMDRLPNSLAYYREALSLPLFPGLSDDDVVRVISGVKEVMG